MGKGFVGFPTIAYFSKTCPADSEFHSGALSSIATVSIDRLRYKFLFVILGDYPRYSPEIMDIVERPEIMDMSSCPLAIDEVFNDIDGDELSLLHDRGRTPCLTLQYLLLKSN